MTIKNNHIVLGLTTLAIAISANVGATTFKSDGLFSQAQFTQSSPLPKRYIVKFKETSIDNSQALSNSETRQNQTVHEHHNALNSVKAREMKRIGASNSYTTKLDESAIKALKMRADVEYVEEDVQRRFLSETTPWGQTFVGATSLSDSLSGNRTICIIDSGYDRSHNDLSGNNVTGTNNSGTANWYEPGNNNAHGTHVAGTIAAIANNEGVVGVLPNQNANIHVIKVFNESGWGYSSSLVSAIDTCVNNGANVVSMSLGGENSSTTERNAMTSHAEDGVLLIAAAGNAGNSTHSYPASYDAVMSVAAVDNNRDHAAFSQYTNQVEISGPGEAILSTVTVGEGRLADINVGGQSYFNNGVVPHNRLVRPGSSYTPAPINGSVTATLAECTISGSNFNCGNMNNKICLVERIGNQGASYPEINAVKACETAGASATIVYSNSALPGLQNPFVTDADSELNNVSVSVDRTTGLALRNHIGSSVTVENTGNEDYEYYNGTSMATPHVSGVATLVWSYHTDCSAAQVRAALNATADDLDSAGRDNRTGFGMVNAVAAKEYLDESCNGPITTNDKLVNGIAKTGLSGVKGEALNFTFDVPAGATDLKFVTSGGSGDADLYVRFDAAPTTSNNTCESENSNSTESCPITNAETGTYYVMVQGYSAFSGVSLTASYTEGSTTEPGSFSNTTSYAIPDNSSVGVTSPIDVTRSGDSGTVTVKVNISHTYIGDLKVELQAPTGASAALHENTGGSANDLVKTYSVNATGIDSSGTWKLKVTDSGRSDIGNIESWEISFN